MKKDCNDMTKKEFLALPYLQYRLDKAYMDLKYDSLVIIATGRKHDSGFRIIEFVPCLNDKPLGRISGGSDVLHIEGIAGFGYDWVKKYETCPKLVPPRAWSIDCLYKSGYLRIFCPQMKLINDIPMSSFELYSYDSKER